MYCLSCRMSFVILKGYDPKFLNNSYVLVSSGFYAVNRSLLRCTYVLVLLYRIRFNLLSFYLIDRSWSIINCKFFLLIHLFILYGGSNFFCSWINSFFFLSRTKFEYSYFLVSFFFDCLLKYVNVLFIYIYWCSCLLFYKNNVFSLPSKVSYETVLRSAHSHKKSREQFSISLHRRGFHYFSFLVTRKGYFLRKIIDHSYGVSVKYEEEIKINVH